MCGSGWLAGRWGDGVGVKGKPLSMFSWHEVDPDPSPQKMIVNRAPTYCVRAPKYNCGVWKAGRLYASHANLVRRRGSTLRT